MKRLTKSVRHPNWNRPPSQTGTLRHVVTTVDVFSPSTRDPARLTLHAGTTIGGCGRAGRLIMVVVAGIQIIFSVNPCVLDIVSCEFVYFIVNKILYFLTGVRIIQNYAAHAVTLVNSIL